MIIKSIFFIPVNHTYDNSTILFIPINHTYNNSTRKVQGEKTRRSFHIQKTFSVFNRAVVERVFCLFFTVLKVFWWTYYIFLLPFSFIHCRELKIIVILRIETTFISTRKLNVLKQIPSKLQSKKNTVLKKRKNIRKTQKS